MQKALNSSGTRGKAGERNDGEGGLNSSHLFRAIPRSKISEISVAVRRFRAQKLKSLSGGWHRERPDTGALENFC